tara:strand:- start:126 stop:350 length:225 start_codon:yes stop_codon:yes gene_type:complete
MPFYVYKCDVCQEQFEIEQKVNDPVLTDCPKCLVKPYSDSMGPQKGLLKKVLQPVATHFKGSGFYETDYKRGGK